MDTLSTATQLEGAGFPISQARAIVNAIIKSQEGLAKEEDIKRLEAKITQSVAQLTNEIKATNTKIEDINTKIETTLVTKAELKAEMLKMELRLTRWFIGIIIANLVTAILVLVQLLS